MPTDSECESGVNWPAVCSDDIAVVEHAGVQAPYLNGTDAPFTVQTQDASLAKLLIILETVLGEIQLREKREQQPTDNQDNA